MNRIERKFQELKKRKKKAFIAFITAGDPSLKSTEELAVAFDRSGVDIIELGIPFSDPLADGPVIQASSQRSIQKGTNIPKILTTVKRIRARSDIPIALMTYYNPVYHYGEKRFISEAKKVGVDGLIVPDLPPEESSGFRAEAKRQRLSTVFFLAPTTTRRRMRTITKCSTGFIYYVSITGVTGASKRFSGKNAANIRSAKRMTKKPVCVGFGVSTPIQVKSVARIADGVIVGSAIIKQIARQTGKRNLVKNVSRYVWTLARGLK